MKKEINETYNSLPDEEKEKLNKFEKQGITEIKQRYDQNTGEVLSVETTYNSNIKRKRGTFYVGSPEELARLCMFNKKNRAIGKMLTYIINTVNWNNEFSFDKSFIESYGKHDEYFYKDRKFLLENKYIFKKDSKKNVFTLNVELFSRGNAYTTSQLYQEQFGEELNQDSKQELAKIKKKVARLSKEDIKNLIKDLQNML